MKVLYVSIISNQISGGTTVMHRNLELIKKVPNIDLCVLNFSMQSKIRALFSFFFDGNFILSWSDEKMIIEKVKKEQYDYVFLEGTTSGHLVMLLRQIGVKLIVFAHNVETFLYKERLHSFKLNLFEKIKYLQVKRNEKRSVEYCSELVVLNSRDKKCFITFFNRAADSIIPISFPSIIKKNDQSLIADKYCLFVGSNFFPNVEGITWFISNVAPYIKMKVKVVGSCCDSFKSQRLINVSNVELHGEVDDLSWYYANAYAVVVPIFKGSGMKTKTIEAMSYGKSIFGTYESFQGIDCDYDKIGGLCNIAHEFIDKINSFDGGLVNEYVRDLFDTNYSNHAVQEKFNQLFKILE